MTTSSIFTLKTIAQCVASDVEFFVVGDVVYEGTEEENKEAYQEWVECYKDMPWEKTLDTFLECEGSVIEYDEDGDYIALTDEEADQKARESILDSLWAFNTSFLAEQTGFDECIFQALSNNGQCESNNNAILKLVESGDNCIDDFVESAISTDGRGHFLNTYDGNEEEVNMKDYTDCNLYIYTYRMN